MISFQVIVLLKWIGNYVGIRKSYSRFRDRDFFGSSFFSILSKCLVKRSGFLGMEEIGYA